mmetsp:Transcript_22890/g.33485  ORF Transcript_22890/g.33485 Transcript_22890/m.33485 type:complete len:183 (-) Transcript_22890:239-787(-)|eukprot:CAMPEP_0195520468 /NCGR_PEP_ID=MMETSP0794_2-20130614/16973_1 /TAXON_ID=515487 /ORGANISM="Stephanopyxis turris, Strain CCMP 815" /LENGTH=182 /DNA_ID=CAMNT_0040649839 /DNA_START=92 /DNA_END=643 /DNA_ORIENTATION=-
MSMFSYVPPSNRQEEGNENNVRSSDSSQQNETQEETSEGEIAFNDIEQNESHLDDYSDDDDEDDDITVIEMESSQPRQRAQWTLSDGRWTQWSTSNSDTNINLENRRAVVHRDLERVQRANFCHFALLCLIPTSLLLIVVVGALQQNGDCMGLSPSCENEPRSFIHAFTTRCICDSVSVNVG